LVAWVGPTHPRLGDYHLRARKKERQGRWFQAVGDLFSFEKDCERHLSELKVYLERHKGTGILLLALPDSVELVSKKKRGRGEGGRGDRSPSGEKKLRSRAGNQTEGLAG